MSKSAKVVLGRVLIKQVADCAPFRVRSSHPPKQTFASTIGKSVQGHFQTYDFGCS